MYCWLRGGVLWIGLALAIAAAPAAVDAVDEEGRASASSPPVAPAGHVAAGSPAPESAAELVDRAFRNLYGEDYVQVMTLATRARGSREMKKRLQITRRQSIRPGKALLRFLAPETIRRTSVLVLENERASDDLYVYLPAVKLTRHLAVSQRSDAFFGTDLSYEDVEPKRAEDWEVTWAGEGEAHGRPCALVELRVREGFASGYERTRSCIERERAIVLWSDFYRHGSVLKRLEIDPEQVKLVGDRHIPFLMTMTTPKRRSETRIITESYDLREAIPDELFSTWNLEVGDARRDRTNAGSPVF